MKVIFESNLSNHTIVHISENFTDKQHTMNEYNEKCSLIARIPLFFCDFLIHKIKLITAIHQLPFPVSIRYFFGMDSESSMDRSRKSTEKIKLFIFITSMNNLIYAEVCNEMLTHNTFIVAYSPKNIIQLKQNKKLIFL